MEDIRTAVDNAFSGPRPGDSLIGECLGCLTIEIETALSDIGNRLRSMAEGSSVVGTTVSSTGDRVDAIRSCLQALRRLHEMPHVPVECMLSDVIGLAIDTSQLGMVNRRITTDVLVSNNQLVGLRSDVLSAGLLMVLFFAVCGAVDGSPTEVAVLGNGSAKSWSIDVACSGQALSLSPSNRGNLKMLKKYGIDTKVSNTSTGWMISLSHALHTV